jgi:UDP-N-acetylglucosamine--N-acetylmuramyl-(pentapeptide) pyrophosphoryl-undecaprenol N-acetylglucosamine transferase
LFFTGGYLAVPVAFAGRSVPSVVFIPDIEPGLAIKTITNLAAQIAVSVDQTRLYIPPAKPVTVSGYPVRAELLKWSREEAFRIFNLNPDLPILLVFGGSKGARSINRAVKGILPELLRETQVIHITGKLDFDEMLTCQDSLSDEELNNYRVFKFLHNEMGAALRIAKLVVSRSGASILGEYPMFGLPAILVPYPHAWRYQKTNAQYLADRGAAEIINDEDLDEKLLPRINALFNNQVELSRMRSNMEILAQPGAAETIAQQLLSLAEIASGGNLL